eukprot:TRINITY_DN112700_c0_g1_i1.p1 TRINITY_DN112700_c0_g1~~TRINITY_DN112700_c0_g1_i1.p1  ORF type:complete len:320 (+),score=73.76 TRINITY_DN112700_c0_g1_i1:187-1146(+)
MAVVQCAVDFVPDDLDKVHIVLVGDSTLDNGRYLDVQCGELSVDRQLAKRCRERGWEMTCLAQDGSMIEDVFLQQVPLIPDRATHIVLSASGNDLLSLLNSMVVANFTPSAMYKAIVDGLLEVSEKYRELMSALKSVGCHLACCTVYQPNFNHFLFRGVAAFGLSLHNNRLKQIAVDLDACVVDLANMFETPDDFANALELSTRGGSKLVENITAFITEHPPASMLRSRHRSSGLNDEADGAYSMASNIFGLPLRCCAAKAVQHRVYCETTLSRTGLDQRDTRFAAGGVSSHVSSSKAMAFSNAQQHWRSGGGASTAKP